MTITTTFTSPADVTNLALAKLGRRERVGNLYDGSDASQIVVGVYGQVRDDLIRSGDWGFARRSAVLTLLKGSPNGGYGPWRPWNAATDPPLPWRFEYAYPTDCLCVTQIKGQPAYQFEFDPKPTRWDVIDDPSQSTAKVIVSDVPSAIAVYKARVTTVSLWDAAFVEALATELAKTISAGLSQLTQPGAESEKQLSPEQVLSKNMALSQRG